MTASVLIENRLRTLTENKDFKTENPGSNRELELRTENCK